MVVFFPITWILYKIGRVKKFDWYGTKNRKWSLIVPTIFLGIGIVYLVLNTMHRIPDPLSISKLVFDDTFLNRRGCWWKASYLAIRNGSLKEKLFGYGLDCSSASKMSDSNKIEFSTRDEAIGAGYEPCKICNP